MWMLLKMWVDKSSTKNSSSCSEVASTIRDVQARQADKTCYLLTFLTKVAFDSVLCYLKHSFKISYHPETNAV